MGATQLVGQGQGGVCAGCGAPLEMDALFCIVCGRPVAEGTPEPVAAPATGDVCARCRTPLEPGAAFCVACGAPVVAQAGADPQAAPVGTARVAGAAPQGYAMLTGASGAQGSCPNCGFALEPGAMYCISCGKRVTESGQAVGGGFGQVDGAGTVRLDGVQGAGDYGWADGPIVPVPAPMSLEDDDDASARPRLVMLSREEARTGCVKSVEVDRATRQSIEVQIPAGVDVNTKLDVMGYGHFDEMTGQRGPLRLSFFID